MDDYTQDKSDDDFMFEELHREFSEVTGIEIATELIGRCITAEYRLVELISISGTSAIYKAERIFNNSVGFEQEVAVKIIFPIIEKILGEQVLSHEAQILANCTHNNIVKVLTVTRFSSDGFSFPCLIMEFIRGKNLIEYCNSDNKNLVERLKLFYEICSAVSYLHSRPIIHGDLKPENIIVDNSGTIKIVDFTIGVTDASLSSYNCITKSYASPNQVQGNPATVSCDVYALGCIFNDLMNGRHPHPRITVPIMKKRSILSIISRATNSDQSIRYRSVESLSADINSVINHYPIQEQQKNWFINITNIVIRQPILSSALIISILVLSKTYYDKSQTQRRLTEANNSLTLSNKKLQSEYNATISASEQISAIFKIADLRYSKGEPLSAENIINEAKSISKNTNLPLHFRNSLYLNYGETYLGIGKVDRAIDSFTEAFEISKLSTMQGGIANNEMEITSVTKLALAYFIADQPIRAKRLIEPYIYNVIDAQVISKPSLDLFLAYFKINGILMGTQIANTSIQKELELTVNKFMNNQASSMPDIDKAKLAFEYANAIYYSFEGDAYSITSGQSLSYIKTKIIPAMKKIDTMLTESLSWVSPDDYMWSEIAILLAKIKYEQGLYDDAVILGQSAVNLSEKIFQSTDNPLLWRIYTKYYTVIYKTRYDLSIPFINKMYTINKGHALGIISALGSAAWYNQGDYTKLTSLKMMYINDDIQEKEYNYVQNETIAITSYNLFTLNNVPYPTLMSLEDLEVMKTITKKQYKGTYNTDPIARLRIILYDSYNAFLNNEDVEIIPYESLVQYINMSTNKDEMYTHFANLYANAGKFSLARKLAQTAVKSIIVNNQIDSLSAERMIFYIRLSNVYSILSDNINMDYFLKKAKKIAFVQNFTSGVHIATISYLEALQAFRNSNFKKFEEKRDESLLQLSLAGVNVRDHPIYLDLNKISPFINTFKNNDLTLGIDLN